MNTPEPTAIPAFPSPEVPGVSTGDPRDGMGYGTPGHPGMDLRDYFAARAMQEILMPMTKMGAATGSADEAILRDVADMAYEMAEAMLARRAKP